MRWPSPVLTYGLWLYLFLLLLASPSSARSTRLPQFIVDSAQTAVITAGNHRVLSMAGAVQRMERRCACSRPARKNTLSVGSGLCFLKSESDGNVKFP